MNLQIKDISGIAVHCRPDTWDEGIAHEVITGDVYSLQELKADGGSPRVICDVGGHIGAFSTYCGKLWPDAKIYLYEPDSDNFKVVMENIKGNSNISGFNYAVVGDPNKTSVNFIKYIDLPHPKNTGGGATTEVENSDSTYRVDALTISHALDAFGHIDLLKLDCEGSEDEILHYALDNDLLNNIGWIRGEWHGADTIINIQKSLAESHVLSYTHSAEDLGTFIAHSKKI